MPAQLSCSSHPLLRVERVQVKAAGHLDRYGLTGPSDSNLSLFILSWESKSVPGALPSSLGLSIGYHCRPGQPQLSLLTGDCVYFLGTPKRGGPEVWGLCILPSGLVGGQVCPRKRPCGLTFSLGFPCPGAMVGSG